MKNMKKLLQRAMVFTLSAAMLVGTPMTASAAGLVDLYSISDGTDIVNSDDKPVGTVTNTDTNTGSLIGEQKAEIVGIALDRETVDAEVGKSETLKATVVLNSNITALDEKGEVQDITDDVVIELSKKIKWEVLYTDENGDERTDMPNPAEKVALDGKADNRSEITLNPLQGTEAENKVTVRATIDASYYFRSEGEVDVPGAEEDTSLNWNNWNDKPDKYIIKDDARAGLIYTADAKVSVKEYSTGLKWKDNVTEETMAVKHTLNLDAELERIPATANDAITWTSSNTKVATVSAAGVVTAKKVGKAEITAVSEHGAVATLTIQVTEGVKADVVKIFSVSEGDDEDVDVTSKTTDKDLATDSKMTLKAVMYAKVSAYTDTDGKVIEPTTSENGEVTIPEGATLTKNKEVENGKSYIDADGKAQTVGITDVITWTSNKPAVATVDANGEVALSGVGTAAITAKATNGKSAKTTVKVAATLGTLTIKGAPVKAYSGQTINLEAVKSPSGNKDAVKWSVTDAEGKKTANATINAKGVLKIANKVTNGEIKVSLETSKAVGTDENGNKVKITADPVTIIVEQSSVDTITVKDGDTVVAKGGFDSNNKKLTGTSAISGTSEINVPLSRTFTASATDREDEADASLLTWKTSSAKVAEIDGTGENVTIKAVGAGTATITVSGVRLAPNGKASVLSVKFKVKVKQPVTSLTMNKPTVTLAQKNKTSKGVTTQADQKVSLKVTFGPKKADKSQQKIASWTVVKNGTVVESPVVVKNKAVTAASLSYTLSQPEAGDVYKITAKSITGATATSTITIVAPTTAVAIGSGLNTDGTPITYTKNATEMTIDGSKIELKSYINIGTKKDAEWVPAGDKDTHAEDVTYTVNKKGIVTVDKYGNVYAVKRGTATITAKTPTGKKATLKVTVK